MKVPLLSGTSLVVVDVPENGVVLRPPPPVESNADVRAAVRDALRFPLAGPPLAALAPRGGRATIVVEPPALPLPAAQHDPRQVALEAASTELERAGISAERQTLLVASGLMRKPARRELEQLGIVSPGFARRFAGNVVIHDAEDPELVELGEADTVPLRVNRTLVETDLVVTVSAAETVLHGGPAVLLGASGAASLGAAKADSLLETGTSFGWRLAVELERRLSERVPVIGVSLVLNQPQLTGAARGYPYEPEATERIASSPLRHGFRLLPGVVRDRTIRSIRRELGAVAAFAAPPSVAHAEALLRAVEARSAVLDEPLDAICIGIPRTTPHLPRERPNPLLAAYLGLGLALRLGPHVPSTAAVRRLGRVRAGTGAGRLGDRLRLPRRGRLPPAGIRPHRRARNLPRDGARPLRQRRANRLPALAALLSPARRPLRGQAHSSPR